MRRRRRLSLARVAATLSRWERGEVTPPPERLNALLTLLGALPEERAVLADRRRFLLPPLVEAAPTPEALFERFVAFMATTHAHTHEARSEVGFLSREAEAWRRAARGHDQGPGRSRQGRGGAGSDRRAAERRAKTALLRAEALLAIEDRSGARDWLARAAADIEAYGYAPLRSHANLLARRL